MIDGAVPVDLDHTLELSPFASFQIGDANLSKCYGAKQESSRTRIVENCVEKEFIFLTSVNGLNRHQNIPGVCDALDFAIAEDSEHLESLSSSKKPLPKLLHSGFGKLHLVTTGMDTEIC